MVIIVRQWGGFESADVGRLQDICITLSAVYKDRVQCENAARIVSAMHGYHASESVSSWGEWSG